jgi:hypothetical protein
MPNATPDPNPQLVAAGAVRFDLSQGTVSGAGGERMLLVPTRALDEAFRVGGAAAGTAVATLIGQVCGERAAAVLGNRSAVAAATIESVATALGAELSLAGLGVLDIERWGKALVLAVHHPVTENALLVAAMCEGAMHAATGRDLSCVALGSEEGVARILVASKSTADRAKALVEKGESWRSIVMQVQAPRTGGAS